MKQVYFEILFNIERVKMRLILPTFMLSLTVTSVFAQATTDGVDKAKFSQCEEFLKNVNVLKPRKDNAVRDIPEGCIISNSIYDSSSFMDWSIERAIVEFDRFQDYLSDTPDLNKAPPQWGRIAVDGIRMILQSGNHMSNYITSIQQWPMDVSASYRFNPESGFLHIQNAEISSTKLGKASISAEINLPAGSSVASLIAHPTATLSHLRIRLDNQGIWESFALPVLANYAALPSESEERDLEADIARLRDLASKAIEMLPDSQINASSRQALLKFIQDMPHPAGFFAMDLQFDPPLPIDSDFIESGKLTDQALIGGKITAIYRAR
ncbi:hypothetical protein [Paenochrobactrum pullorum]|uniref:hypothetical protein n=1 Tax=Paenochrobactrum pullorum TaxID=1324351 RepID=UPI0035BC1A95